MSKEEIEKIADALLEEIMDVYALQYRNAYRKRHPEESVYQLVMSVLRKHLGDSNE